MCANMARIPALRDRAVGVRRAKRIDRVGAIVLLVCLAVLARQVGADLRTNTHAVADLDGLHVLADLDSLADDLVADANGERAAAPAAVDGVDIAAADAAAVDGDVDVAVFEGLELELWWRYVSVLTGWYGRPSR